MDGVLQNVDVRITIPHDIKNKGYKVAKLTPNIIESIVRRVKRLQGGNLSIKRDRLATYGIIFLDANTFRNNILRMRVAVSTKAVKLVPDYMNRIRELWRYLFKNEPEKVEVVNPISINNPTTSTNTENTAPQMYVNSDGTRVVDYGNGNIELYSKEGNIIEEGRKESNIAPQDIVPTFNNGLDNNRVNELLERNAKLETDLSAEKLRANQLEETLNEEKNRPMSQLDHIERVVIDIRDNMDKLIIPSLKPMLIQGVDNRINNDIINDPSVLNNDHHLTK